MMAKHSTGNRQADAIRELTADELELVSGGGKSKDKPQEFLVLTLKECIITGYSL
jgi:hypothetical protein